MSRCVYTSFFTPDYTEPASRLVNSLHAHDLDYDVQKVPDAGTWMANCARKPKFIYEQLAKMPGRPVVWTDADSEVIQGPSLFEESIGLMSGIDAAVCEYTWKAYPKRETFSGTIWFAPTPGALRLVDIWAALQTVSPNEMDQRVLARAVELARAEGVRVATLPVEYCFITDLHRREWPDKKPVFEHFQHSRIRRRLDAKNGR